MIPSAFNYHRPETVDGVVSLLAEWGDDARVIAGGHSLIPVMKQRLTDISHLIDLAAVETLKGISPASAAFLFGSQVAWTTNRQSRRYQSSQTIEVRQTSISIQLLCFSCINQLQFKMIFSRV